MTVSESNLQIFEGKLLGKLAFQLSLFQYTYTNWFWFVFVFVLTSTDDPRPRKSIQSPYPTEKTSEDGNDRHSF